MANHVVSKESIFKTGVVLETKISISIPVELISPMMIW